MATLPGMDAALVVHSSSCLGRVAGSATARRSRNCCRSLVWLYSSKPSSSSSPCCIGYHKNGSSSAPGLQSLGLGVSGHTQKKRNGRFAAVRIAETVTAPFAAASAVFSSHDPGGTAPGPVRPSSAEAARTIVDICTEGTLSMLSEDEWPTATAVRFALDAGGNPVFRFSSSALHTRNLAADSRSSLHVQLEQPGQRRPQCTLRGRIRRVDDPNLELKLNIAWERRFGKERAQEDAYYVMNVEQALHAQDMGEEEVWVSGGDFSSAVADPLRECAARIVEDMNRKHWEDVRRFCNCHARLEAEVEEASMTWVDRLGFDVRVLTQSPETLLEIRIPFSREVSDERDARSSLTMMAQIAWEYERNYSPPDVPLLSSFNISS